MIDESFYLSDEKKLPRAVQLTGLSMDEIEYVVGRFRPDHRFGGLLKGELIKSIDAESDSGYSVSVRHHFTKKKLWSRKA